MGKGRTLANDAARLMEPWQADVTVRRLSAGEPQPAPSGPENDDRQNYYIGEFGHRIVSESGVNGLFHIGPCHECDEEPAVKDPRLSMAGRTTRGERTRR